MSSGTTSARRFKSVVDNQINGGDNWGFQPWFAALVSQSTGTASYCTYAVSKTDAFVASEEARINANQAATVAGDSYLEVGDIIGNVAVVYDWCRGQMNASQRTRWVNYANQAVWNVWNYNQAKWGTKTYPWSGWSVDNPSNNYYYSFLRATMLLGLATYDENSQAPAWIAKFRTEKIANQLVPTFNRDLVGGGSREGTGYGVAMKGLFDLYYWWEKSTSERIADLTPHTLASFDKFMHDIVPTLDRVSPTGDHSRDSTAALFDYHREYLEILSRLYPSDAMAGISKTLLAQSSVPQMQNGFEMWIDFLYDQSDIAAQPLSRLPTAHWGSGTGQFSTRSAWTTDASYANFICGPYTESHAHHDQGSFVFFKGNWLGIDENLFSHSGLAQAEAPHNLVRIESGGSVVPQKDGKSCTMRALADTSSYSYASADVTPVYGGAAAVNKVEREFVFLKPGVLVVLDRVQTTGSGVKKIWTFNLGSTPTINGANFTALSGSNQVDVMRLAPSGLSSSVVSWPSADSDMSGGARVDVVDTSAGATTFLHVIGADHAISSAVRSDSGTMVGAQVRMANGNTATVRFNASGAGGTIDIVNSSGAAVVSGALPTTVTTPARLAN